MGNDADNWDDAINAPGPPKRRRSDRSPHDRIDELEDDIASLRERVAAVESATRSLGKLIENLRSDIAQMRSQLSAEVGSLRTDIIKTFSRLFLGLIFVILIAFAMVGGLLGGNLSAEGLGLSISTGRPQVDAAPAYNIPSEPAPSDDNGNE